MRATIAAIGRALVTLGLLILLFVGYQLWGTGIAQARSQNRLEDQFADLLDRVSTTTTQESSADTTTSVEPSPTTTSTSPESTTTAPSPLAAGLPKIGLGDPIAKIQIPRIGVDSVVVQGTSRDDLKKGPGHYPSTPIPGQVGNAAIAGHRTTYGGPFNRLDELQAGDLILTQSLVGESVYVVTEVIVVEPTDVGVVADTPGEPWLTLTTCNPEYSARERLVVKAEMVEEKSDPPAPPSATRGAFESGANSLPAEQSLEAGLAGDADSRAPAAGWGLLTAVAGLAWWWAFRRWRLPVTWIGGAVPFLAVLFVFYMYLERTLPAGY